MGMPEKIAAAIREFRAEVTGQVSKTNQRLAAVEARLAAIEEKLTSKPAPTAKAVAPKQSS